MDKKDLLKKTLLNAMYVGLMIYLIVLATQTKDRCEQIDYIETCNGINNNIIWKNNSIQNILKEDAKNEPIERFKTEVKLEIPKG